MDKKNNCFKSMSLTADCKKELLINWPITTNSATNVNVTEMFAFE